MAARMLVAWAVTAGATPVPEAIRVCEQLIDVAGREHPMVLSFPGGPAGHARRDRRRSRSYRSCAGTGARADARAVSNADRGPCAGERRARGRRPRRGGARARRRAGARPRWALREPSLIPPRACPSSSSSVTRQAEGAGGAESRQRSRGKRCRSGPRRAATARVTVAARQRERRSGEGGRSPGADRDAEPPGGPLVDQPRFPGASGDRPAPAISPTRSSSTNGTATSIRRPSEGACACHLKARCRTT